MESISSSLQLIRLRRVFPMGLGTVDRSLRDG